MFQRLPDIKMGTFYQKGKAPSTTF